MELSVIKLKSLPCKLTTCNFNSALPYLFIFPSANDSVKTVKSTRSDKKDIGCVDLHSLAAQLTGILFWNIHYCTFQQLQQALQVKMEEMFQTYRKHMQNAQTL